MNRIDKNRPDPAWIEDLRRRFPCEREIDRVLTRKLHRRSGPAYSPIAINTLVQGIDALLRKNSVTDFRISDPRWLSGGASKIQMAFALEWDAPDVGRTSTDLVLRMEPPESIVETSRLREFQIIKAFTGRIPVPPTYWVDPDGECLPHPAIVYGFAQGVTKPSNATSGVSGLATNLGPTLRPLLGPQFVEHLAAIHCFDWRSADIDAFDKPTHPTQTVEWQLNWWERLWNEDANEDVPLMRLAMAWMSSNMPAVDHVSMIHGDYRTGNFLFTEEDNRISAWLDWELAHLGDRHEDLAYATNVACGHLAEDGKTFLISGLMSEAEFYAAYERSSGLSVDARRLAFYRIFNAYKAVVITLATGYRIARNAKTHQDILIAWLMGVSGPLLEQLRDALDRAINAPDDPV
jgi:aminoglycoside phosphotransferase (APT) family kinase protein